MAKSLFAAGAEAGFDMRSQKGIDAWMRQASSMPPDSFPLPFGMPARPARDADAKAKKKEQRKAAKKAGRKNR
jgi:hypothetical protein